MIAKRVHGPFWTVEQYLEMERQSPIRHEFIDGYVYAMAGGTQRHDRIVRTITRLLEDHLEDNPCQVFSMNMKVRLANDKDYVYADATVTCDPRDVANDLSDHISDPLLVVEVLSDSTEKHDQGTKFDLYRDRDTLIEYMLIETEHVGVEVRTRDADGVWSATTYGPGQAVYLASVDMDILVQELYRGTAL
jgi:Uma2 family endonuclease